MRTEKKVALLVAVSLVVLGVAMATIAMTMVKWNFTSFATETEYQQKSYDISEDFDSIEIKSGDQDITIVKSDDNNAHFTCYENDDISFDVKVEGKTLHIEENTKKKWNINLMEFSGDREDVLYLPKDTYESLSVMLGSGDIKTNENFTFSAIEAKVGSGDINISNLQCKNKFEFEVASGKVIVTDTVSKGSFDISTGSGDIQLNNCEGLTVELNTGSGAIEFSGLEGTSINMVTGSGDVEGSLKSGKVFDAITMSGDCSVPANEGNGTCTVRTGSGDIELWVE